MEEETGCHIWGGSVLSTGYGQYRTATKNWLAHRMVYELLVGPIPEGFQVHHRCENRLCVNVSHLELLTIEEHWRLGNSPSAIRARATHCQHGHEFTAENTHIARKTGYRRCRTCALAYQHARRAAARAVASETLAKMTP